MRRFHAFLLCHTHADIKKEVDRGGPAYSFALELGRIPDKREQLSFLRRFQAREGEELTIGQFAKRHPVLGATALKHAIIFAGLHLTIKKMNHKGLLHYSAAVAIGDLEVDEDEKLSLAMEASLLGYGAEELKNKRLQEKSQDAFGFFQEGKVDSRRRLVRDQVAQALSATEMILSLKDQKMPAELLPALANYFLAYQLAEDATLRGVLPRWRELSR